MGLQEPSWTHDPEPTKEILQFSFDFHGEDDRIMWLPVQATVTMNGNSADIECSYNILPILELKPCWPFWRNDLYIDSQILEDQLRDHFSEIYTEFDIEFNRI